MKTCNDCTRSSTCICPYGRNRENNQICEYFMDNNPPKNPWTVVCAIGAFILLCIMMWRF